MTENKFETYFPIVNDNNIDRLKFYAEKSKKLINKYSYLNLLSTIKVISYLPEEILHYACIKLSLRNDTHEYDAKIMFVNDVTGFQNLSSSNIVLNRTLGIKLEGNWGCNKLYFYCGKEFNMKEGKEFFMLEYHELGKGMKSRSVSDKASKKLILGSRSNNSSLIRKLTKYIKLLNSTPKRSKLVINS